MAVTTGVTRYEKLKWMNQFAARMSAGNLKLAIYNSNAVFNPLISPTTPETYTTLNEMSDVGTGYISGGFVLDEPVLSTYAGSGVQLQYSSVGAPPGTVATGVGTIPAGNYPGIIYDISDSNRIVAAVTVSVTQGSVNGVMVFSVPAAAFVVV